MTSVLHSQTPLGSATSFSADGQRHDDRYLITVRGELDQSTARLVEPLLSEAGDAHEIVFDLGPVTFIDSAGLRLFVIAHKQVGLTGGQVVIRRPTPILVRLLDITGLDSYLTIEA